MAGWTLSPPSTPRGLPAHMGNHADSMNTRALAMSSGDPVDVAASAEAEVWTLPLPWLC